MNPEWDGMEGVDAAERVIRSALQSAASEVHISGDSDGATVYFISPERMEFFTHLPPDCRDGVFRYLRGFACVDDWEEPPVSGVGTFAHDGGDCQIDVRFLCGDAGQDVILRIARG